jgi:hypothetical protein
MQSFQNFTSLPPHEEQTFIVYEQRMADASRSGVTLAAICGAIVLAFAFFIYLGVEPKEIDYAKDMNMSNLSKKAAPAPSTAPAAAPAPAPAPAGGTTPAPGATPPTEGAAPAPAPAGGTAPAPAAGTAPAEAPAPK